MIGKKAGDVVSRASGRGVTWNARIADSITVLGHQILTRENSRAKDDDGDLAWVGLERVSATAITGGHAKWEVARQSEGRDRP